MAWLNLHIPFQPPNSQLSSRSLLLLLFSVCLSVLEPKGDIHWEGLPSHQQQAPHSLTLPGRLHQGFKGRDQSPLKTGLSVSESERMGGLWA